MTRPSEPELRRPGSSLLMWSAARRLAAAAVLLLGLWLAVAWALSA